MALLRRASLLLLLHTALGCDADSGVGRIDLDVYDVPVVCDPERDSCASPTGEAVAALPSGGEAFISAPASRFAPGGLYLYFELIRPRGARALVELDFPTGSGFGGPGGGPHALYQEVVGDRLIFRSTRATGRIEATAVSSDCDCRDGRLELVFTDPGPDGALDTADDQVRRLSRGRFRLGGSYCRAAQLLPVPDDPAELEVAGLFACPSAGSGGGGGGGDYYYEEDAVGGCDVEDDGYDDGGCEGDDGSYDDGYYDDGGCEGDTSSDYDSSGCEGDTSGDYDSSGCEGDSSSSSASCEGDAYGATTRPRRVSRRQRSRDRALGMLLPFVVLGLLHGGMRRRDRRRSRATSAPSCR